MTFTQLRSIVATELKIDLTTNQEEQLSKFLFLLQEWNNYFNLTAITDTEKVIEKHFYDCLIPAKYVMLDHKSLIDIGTGAGFPGLVLAIAFPNAHITLLEPNNKKIRFLNTVISALSLKNVHVICGRAESQPQLREQFDYAIARAVKPLNILIELCLPFVKVNGLFLAMKSQGVDDEIRSATKACTVLKCSIKEKYVDYLPTDQDERVNLVIVKNDKTPLRYPRPYSQISAKPL